MRKVCICWYDLFYIGSSIGILYIFEVNESSWKLLNSLYDHTKSITYIFVSNSLNLIATSSLDGYVNLYTYPNNRLIRSIYLSGDVDITADYVIYPNIGILIKFPSCLLYHLL